MVTYSVKLTSGSDKLVNADDYNVEGDFIHFTTEQDGTVFTIRAKDVMSVEMRKA